MEPYRRHLPAFACQALLCLLVGILVTCFPWSILHARAFADDAHPELSHIGDALGDALIKSGDEHYYSLDYDRALHDYEKRAKLHPTDTFAVNEQLKTVIFKELYRLDLLDTTMYAHDGFLIKTEPEATDHKVRERMEELYQRALMLEDNRLNLNPNDLDALYCRGVTRGLKSTYMALVDKSFVSALRNAIAARHDHERVLEMDPGYVDAKTVVGADLYVVGSLPLPVKIIAGMTGFSGSKKKGLQYLNDVAAAHSTSSVDARVALALFLRREAQYGEALGVVQSLVAEHPRNFLFALEEANILKDQGNGLAAATVYRKLLADGKGFPEAHFELAAFGLGEVLRGRKEFEGALSAYDSIGGMSGVQPKVRIRALLASGEMYDQLGNRDMAMKCYQQVVKADASGQYALAAQKHMKHPFDVHGN